MKEQYLEVGKITNVHGIMGEVRVQPLGGLPGLSLPVQDPLCWTAPTGPSRWSGPGSTKNMRHPEAAGRHRCQQCSGHAQRRAYIDRKDVRLPEGSAFSWLT